MNNPTQSNLIPENREAFFSRLRPLLAPSELMRVEIAYALAKHAHRFQERKELDSGGRPIRYFEHLRATALILIDELKIHDPDMIIACLMHDSIEDTTDINERMLEHLFGANVCKIVKLLTKNPEDPKGAYYRRLQDHGNAQTLIVKGCDRLSNLRTLSGCDKAFQTKQILETIGIILPILIEYANQGNPGAKKIEWLIAVQIDKLENQLKDTYYINVESL